MTKKWDLGSFILHPQLKSKHANKESEKLTNHDTDKSSQSTRTTVGDLSPGGSSADETTSTPIWLE